MVCGLGVSASDDSTLLIESGMALDYQGRMVVVEEPLLRKLQMIEGQETLQGQESAYLCLSYDETDVEPVNAVGADTGASRQCNMTSEGCRLFLTAQPPEFRGLLEAAGRDNVSVLYASKELTLVLCAPEAVCAGEEFTVEVLVVKNERTPPVHFKLEGESAFVDSGDGRIRLAFQESPEEKRRVYTASFQLKARQLGGVDSPLFPSGGEIDLELGSHSYKNYIEVDSRCHLCGSQEELEERRQRTDNLERHLRGRDIPHLPGQAGTDPLGGQYVPGLGHKPPLPPAAVPGGLGCRPAGTAGSDHLGAQPGILAEAGCQIGVPAFHRRAPLRFRHPRPRADSRALRSHGTVDLTMPGGLRVNSRVFSDEIAHGLGPGAVDVRLSVEFADQSAGGETALYFGNSEVFKGKTAPTTPPWVEAAALVYPERGTMRIGLWLHDMVDGNRVTVHYFAQKPERDTSRILAQRQVSLTVTPEFAHVSRRGTLRLQAEVVGSEDKGVQWKVNEEGGGSIDRNGVYQAPEMPGTYEIVAVASADENVRASAFVIVE